MQILGFSIIMVFSLIGVTWFFCDRIKKLKIKFENDIVEFYKDMTDGICDIIVNDTKNREKHFDLTMKKLDENSKLLKETEKGLHQTDKNIGGILNLIEAMQKKYDRDINDIVTTIDAMLNPEKYKPKPPSPKEMLKNYAKSDINKELANKILPQMHPLDRRQLFKKFFIQTTSS